MSNLSLGAACTLTGQNLGMCKLEASQLLTHAVVVGMTGSGKTGLLTVMVEEALRARVPVLMIDIKGDLPNLKLAFPSFDVQTMMPWVEPAANDEDGIADEPLVQAAAQEREQGLRKWGIDEAALASFHQSTNIRVFTPGSDAGEMLHLFSALERPSSRWQHDEAGARATLSATLSLLLRLTGREGDPGKSREHAFLSVLAEARLNIGLAASLEELLPEVLEPPFDLVGALPVETYLPLRARKELAADLNTLIASPSFAAWRQGESLDVSAWLNETTGKTPATVISVAHLGDDERELVLGVVLEEVLAWVRTLPGSSRLKALIVCDEVFGMMPPHPQNPPTKKPLVALMKQARAFGVGCVVATQNPMDLDYRALSNAGTWFVGRLQTDADRQRIVEGMGVVAEGSRPSGRTKPSRKTTVRDGPGPSGDLNDVLKKLSPRWFVMRTVEGEQVTLLNPRYAMSYLKGPMTPSELRRLRDG